MTTPTRTPPTNLEFLRSTIAIVAPIAIALAFAVVAGVIGWLLGGLILLVLGWLLRHDHHLATRIWLLTGAVMLVFAVAVFLGLAPLGPSSVQVEQGPTVESAG